MCIKIDNTTGDAPKLIGRHFEVTDHLVTRITRDGLDALKEYVFIYSIIHRLYLGCCKLENEILKEAKNLEK